MLVGLLGHKQLASGIDCEHTVEFFGRNLGDMAKRLHAGVRNDNVEVTIVLDSLFEKGDNLCGLRDVCFNGNGFGTQGFDLGDDLVGCVCTLSVVDDQGGAAAGELESILATHTTPGAGDKGDFTVQAGGGWGGR